MWSTLIDILTVGAKLLPVSGFFLFSFLLFLSLGWRKIIRESFAVAWTLAAVALGVACVAITELASSANHLTHGFCLSLWLLADFGLVALVTLTFKGTMREFLSALSAQISRWRLHFKSQTGMTKALLLSVVAFLLLVGVFALETPTTAWDCQTYHMPRVMHWLQQRNLHPYATNIPRQDDYPPGGEMAVTQLMLLTGNDQPANLPQWWSLVTVVVIAGFVTQELLALTPLRKSGGGSPSTELCAVFAMILAATTPGAAVESITCLGNLLTGQWAMSAIVLGFLVLRHCDNWLYHVGCGSALALGICVKNSTFIYLAPFVLLAAIVWLRQRAFSVLFKLGLTSLVLICLLNGRWMWQNYRRLGNPLIDSSVYAANANTSVTPAKVAATLIRNLSFYTRTPSSEVTADLNAVLELAGDAIGEPLDDRTALFNQRRFEFQGPSAIADGSGLGTCYTALLLVVAAVGFVVRFKQVSALGAYLAAIGASFILFSAVLRWDPWHTRLEFNYFLLAAPFAAAVLAGWFNKWLMAALAAFLLLNATLEVTANPVVPVIAATLHTKPRESLYFVVRPELRAPTMVLADDIVQSGFTNVLLKTGSDSWEYPLWALLQDRGFKGRIQHALVENITGSPPPPSVDSPGTVLLATRDAQARIPDEFCLVVNYDSWRACYKAAIPDERVRMIGRAAVVKMVLPEDRTLTVSFDPYDSLGNWVTNGSLILTVENVDTQTLEIGKTGATNFPLASPVQFSCDLLAGGVAVLVTNTSPTDSIAYLSHFKITSRIPSKMSRPR
jgi:hypothetical protein